MRLSEACEQYRQDVILFRNQSSRTEEHLQCAVKSLVTFLGDIECENLTFAMVREWKISMEKRHLSVQTIRGYLIRLRCVLKYLEIQGCNCLKIDSIPLPKRVDTVPEFISKEDVVTLINFAKAPQAGYPRERRYRNAAIISLIYASGVRVGELCSLNRADIKDGSFTIIGKGNKPRLCFVDARTQQLVKDYLLLRTDNNPALFRSTQNNTRITPEGVQVVFRCVRKKAGFDAPVHPHTLRHTFATELLKTNTNLRYVQALLGHESIQTTQMYTHVVDKDLEAIYRQHHRF